MFDIFIYFYSLHVSGEPCDNHQEKIAVSMRHWYLSICMDGVWSAGWIETYFNPISRPDATHTE